MNARRPSDAGHIALYALVLVPFMMTMSVIAVDLSGWNALRDRLQREVDRIAFEAAQTLPNAGQADFFAHQSLSSLGIQGAVPTVDVSPSFVRVGISTRYNASFDAFVGDRGFNVYRESVVQLVPTDYVVILADGQSLRPEVGEAPWGDSSTWPASGYWNCATYPAPESERWATQSCFNPAFSSLKLAAISLVDVFGAVANNRVGVIATPGTSSGLGYAVLRRVRGEVTVNGTTYFPGTIGGFVDPNLATAESHWDPYIDPVFPTGDEACVLYAHPSWDSRYPLPGTFPYFGFQHAASNCQEPIEFFQCAVPYGVVSSCYQNETLRLRESIYWRSAKRPEGAFSGEPEIIDAIEEAIVQLVDAGSQELLDYEASVRGNLGFKTLRTIVVLTDRLPSAADPRVAGITQLLESANVSLVLVAMYHTPGLDAAELTALQTNAAGFRALSASLTPNRLRVLEAQNPDQLTTVVVPKLISLGRQLALQT